MTVQYYSAFQIVLEKDLQEKHTIITNIKNIKQREISNKIESHRRFQNLVKHLFTKSSVSDFWQGPESFSESKNLLSICTFWMEVYV